MKTLLSIATAVLSFTAMATAQTTPTQNAVSQAKPSAYGTAEQNYQGQPLPSLKPPSPYAQSVKSRKAPSQYVPGPYAQSQFAQSQTAPMQVQPGTPSQGTSRPVDEPILSNPVPSAAAYAPADGDQAPAAPAYQAPGASPTYASPAYATPIYRAPAAASQNPDAGIVTVPVPDDATPTTTSRPRLQSHIYNPDADIVTEVAGSPNQLPEGTPLHARLVSGISAESTTPGAPFSAQLTQSVVHMGTVVIPAGSFLHGRVAYVSAGRRITGSSTVRLRPEEVVLPDGTHYHIRGIVTQTAGSDTRANAEGEIVAKGHPYRTASEFGMTAGSGAVIGGVVAGPVGVVAGAGIGAGVMTVHLLRQKTSAELPAGSEVTFALSSPIALTATSGMVTPMSGMATTTQNAPLPASSYVEPKIQN